MRQIQLWPLILLMYCVAFSAFADSVKEFEADWNGGSTIVVRVPYTVGTHDVTIQKMEGRLKWNDQKHWEGHFSIPLTSIDTGGSKRDCHMRESLGLDYKKSKYPDEHVCSSENTLDETTIAYPLIEFEVEDIPGLKSPSDVKDGEVRVKGKWKIHGVTKEVEIPVTLSLENSDSKRISLDASFTLHLSDYGVIVKKAFIISVKDEISVRMHLFFLPLKTTP